MGPIFWVIIAVFYILLGIGVAAGVRSVTGIMGFFKALIIVLFWPPILIGLVTIRLLE